MIAIRLLGGAKKAVGRPLVGLDRNSATVSEILNFLQGMSSEPRLLQPGNLIIAVNGVDSAAIAGASTVAKDGDEVTVVTVVHGG
ncbi:MAG: MoaD/ThiS family protein [Nitrososphaera sp.]|uniref:MoaD/ThiS family protein n=1 Tax=Nitrososphaera sp. TaxID=1971748 RepID=UPI0017D3C757|nr:MoaD/ThiS family protein [Nitrososphaera sp.]NWG37254.1 MoaD/ThiS family protein [Nitrososphaera sp.]